MMNFRPGTKGTIGALGGVGLLMFSLSASAVNIDLFTTDQAALNLEFDTLANAGDTAFSQAGDATDTSILGGFRDLYLELIEYDTVGGTQDPDGERARLSVTSGALRYSNETGVKSYAEVVWDGDNSYDGTNLDAVGLRAGGLQGIDLTNGGTLTDFLVETIAADLGWNFEIIAYTDADNFTIVNLQATQVDSGEGPVFTTIPFSAFSTCPGVGPGVVDGVNYIACQGAGADLTNLGALQVRLNVGADGEIGEGIGTFDIDLRLGSITATVPEPGSLALLGMGLMAAGAAIGLRRRTRMDA